MRRLDRYIVSEILPPLGLGFTVYTFILLLQFLFKSADLMIRRGIPGSVVGKMLAFSLPNIVVLTIPMALLFGILVTIGRLSSDSELTAMRAGGVSLFQLYRPILIVSVLCTLVTGWLMLQILPWGNSSLQRLRLEILAHGVSQQIQPRTFYEEWQGKVVYIFEVPEGEDRWHGVFLAESIPGDVNEVTVAEWGEIRIDPNGERLVLRLENAVTHKVSGPGRYEISRHRSLETLLEEQFTSNRRAKIQASKGPRSLTLKALLARANDPDLHSTQRNLAKVEIHKKFAIPAACIVFGLLALPFGFNNQRGGKSSGFALSIGVIFLYNVLLSNGEEAARVGKLAPWFAMWLPNIFFAITGTFVLARKNRDKSILLTRTDRWIRDRFWILLGSLGEAWKKFRSRRKSSYLAPDETPPSSTLDDGLRTRGFVLRLPRLRMRFPNLLDRYVFSQFLRVFVLVLLSVTVVYIIADLTEKMDDMAKNGIAGRIVLRYYTYLSLQIFNQVAPIVVLLTSLITFSLLSRTNEVTAAKALGTSLYRLTLPTVVACLLVAITSLVLQERILPSVNVKISMYKDMIRGRETARTYRRADRQWLFGQGRYVYNYRSYDPQTETLEQLQIFEFDEGFRLSRRLSAGRATYSEEGWIFENGWIRSFDGVRVSDFRAFQKPVLVDYPETPEYFESEVRGPDQMSFGELREFLAERARMGQPRDVELEVILHNKLAMPAVSLVMGLVGLPFAFRLGRKGTLFGVGLAIILGMALMAVIAFSTTLGQAGVLPPWLAAWAPNMVFAIFSLYMFLGIET